MLVLVVAVTIGLLVALVLFAMNFGRLLGGSQEHATAIQAASLAAAQDISRIVIEDPNFGFISLSDYPPVGKATIAGDGEPMPVFGINTIVATARLDIIVANELRDDTMKAFATRDASNARQAAQRLITAVKASLQPDSQAKDLDGQPVTPYEDAKRAYDANLVKMAGSGQTVRGSFKLSLGYLDGGSSTLTATPKPDDLAQVPDSAKQDGNYKAFIDIPAYGEQFYFAGVGEQSRLVATQSYRDDDGIRIPSIVRVEADQEITELGKDEQTHKNIIHTVACAQPVAIVDDAAPGTICISFPSGDVPGIAKPGDLADNPQLKLSKSKLFSPEGGDWPGDGVLAPSSFITPAPPSVSQVWSAGLYSWIRNARTRPNIKDLKAMQGLNLSALGNPGSGPNLISELSLCQRAYADDHQRSGQVQTGILSLPVGSPSDDRLEALIGDTGEGRRAYWGMAGYGNVQSQLPPSALMVSIDDQGHVLSADGSAPLSLELIHSFWARTAESNAAGLACMAMANEVMKTEQRQIDEISRQIMQSNDSIAQLSRQLQTDMSLTPDQTTQMRAQVAELTNQTSQLASSLQVHQGYLSAGQDALQNGTMVASLSDTIVRNQRALTARGLSQDGANFKLAGVSLVPHPRPPASLDAIRNRLAPSGDSGPTDWTAKTGFYFYEMPQIRVSARPGASNFLPAAHAASVIPQSLAKMYLFEINADGRVRYTVLPASPFMNIPVSEKQRFAVSYNAITTGTDVPVTWAMVMRDQTAEKGRINGGKHGGEPMVGSPLNWCDSPTFGSKRSSSHRKSRGRALGHTQEFGQGNNSSLGNLLAGDGNSQGGPINLPPGPNPSPDGGQPGAGGARERQSYICGGMSTEFQLRTPLVGNCGFAAGSPQTLSAPRGSNLVGMQSAGQATVQLPGLTLPIPNTANFTVTSQFGSTGPGTTIAPGSSTPTSQCPPAPPDLL